MRLFISYNVDEAVRSALAEEAEELKKVAISGEFCPSENYHLTLSYLGECERCVVDIVEEAIREAAKDFASFSASLDVINCFSKPDGKIVWSGVSSDGQFEALHQKIVASLEKRGFIPPDPEKRDHYCPHMTIAKQVDVRSGDLARIPKKMVSFDVKEISLMMSSRIHGQSVYTKLQTFSLH